MWSNIIEPVLENTGDLQYNHVLRMKKVFQSPPWSVVSVISGASGLRFCSRPSYTPRPPKSSSQVNIVVPSIWLRFGAFDTPRLSDFQFLQAIASMHNIGKNCRGREPNPILGYWLYCWYQRYFSLRAGPGGMAGIVCRALYHFVESLEAVPK